MISYMAKELCSCNYIKDLKMMRLFWISKWAECKQKGFLNGRGKQNKVSIMKQERDWPSLDLQMAKKKKGSKVKKSEKTLKAKKSQRNVFFL